MGEIIGNIGEKVKGALDFEAFGTKIKDAVHNLFDQSPGTIFVTGCNGVITKRVATRLLDAEYPLVRLGTHFNDKSEMAVAEEFNKKGAQLADFSFDRTDTFGKALQGVHTVFCTTPHTEDFVEQFESFLEACKVADVKHIVKLSFYYKIQSTENKKVPWIQRLIRCDDALIDSGIHFVVLGATHLMSNPMVHQGASLRDKSSPVYFYGASGDKPVNYVSPNDVAEVATRVLLAPKEHNKPSEYNGMEYSLTGREGVKDSEVALLLSSYLEKEVKYVEQTLKEFEEGEQFSGGPAWLVADLVGLESIKATGSEEAEDFVTYHIDKVCERRAETFKEYLSNTAAMTLEETP